MLTISQAFNTVAQNDSRISVLIAKATQTDSAAMKTISVLGLTFLPGTFVCVRCATLLESFLAMADMFQALFSTSFFNFSPGSSTEPQHWTISEKFWIYWAVAIPVTIATVAFWFRWQHPALNNSLR